MIPLQLQIKNFLSYGSQVQTINFEPYHLICLSGKNGHGKSALLDAITWALWGQARKISGTAKADSHLLRLGQTHMMIMFDFAFNNQHYRIKREYAQAYGKPYAILEFGLLNPETDHLITLTDKTIRDTQAKIEAMIGLDYESFINSAFLRQGQANEFSKKSPKERKDILGTILGLGHYELLRKRAVDKSKQAVLDTQHLIKLQHRIETDLQQTTLINANILAIDANLTTIKNEEQVIEQQLSTLKERKKERALLQQQQQLLTFQQEQILQHEKTEQQLLRNHYAQWRSINKQYRSLPDVTTLDAEKKNVTARINHHQYRLQKILELKELYLQEKEQEQRLLAVLIAEGQKKIHEKKIILERLKNDYINKQVQHNELEKKINEHTAELTTLNQERIVLEHDTKNNILSDDSATVEKQFEKRKRMYHTWVAQANLTKNELTQLEKKQQLTHDENNPSCPLCEQNLSASRKKFLKSQFIQQEQLLKHTLQRFTKILPLLKEILVKQHTALTELKNNAAAQQLKVLRLEELHKTVTKLTTLLHALAYQKSRLEQEINDSALLITQQEEDIQNSNTSEQQVIKNNQDYQTIILSLTSIQTNIQELSYDQIQHQQDAALLLQLEQKQSMLVTIMHDYALQQQRAATIHQHCLTLKTVSRKKNELQQQLTECISLQEQFNKLLEEEQTTINLLKQLQITKEKALQEKGSLEHQRSALITLEQEHKQNNILINQLNATTYDYQTIATALSKDGIQALLIEDAIPEIEQEANMLLGQLTDNQAHIFIESLRDLKKGGTKETLDIKISDPHGIRPYEMFSGGEAFRIDFALRIAISKLLARRAGTSLQTLIIDEGFGSQDEEGLTHIMDALYKIQDDFCKIIIVSHLPAMKDQFPVHFYVEKGIQGTTVRVVEQG